MNVRVAVAFGVVVIPLVTFAVLRERDAKGSAEEARVAGIRVLALEAVVMKLAANGAEQGDTQAVLIALDTIEDKWRKDAEAEKWAYKLQAFEHASGAVEVAKTISEGARRNSVLSKLNKGVKPK